MSCASSSNAIVLISCPDKKGLVAVVTAFIAEHHGNIVDLAQHVDREENVFLMRVEWELGGFSLKRDELVQSFAKLADLHQMTWQLHFSDRRMRMAIFVSKLSHCLHDLLSRHEAGELDVDIPLIVSNHDKLSYLGERFAIPFEHIEIGNSNREQQETLQLELLKRHRIDFIVLARYMQILSPLIVSAFRERIINIHHSFLPAFAGAKPYHRAYHRGVKIIGATSHFVTEDLDEGPIIAQEVIGVTHRESLLDFVRHGKDLEKMVLARAVWHYLRHNIIVYNNKTVVF